MPPSTITAPTPLQIAARLPKVQLHLHLDGSLPESFLSARATELNRSLPCPPSALRAHLLHEKHRAQAANRYIQTPTSNWSIFTFCTDFLQTSNALHQATQAIVTTLLSHNVRLIELRFCPFLHLDNHLSPFSAVAAVVQALQDSTPAYVRGGVILCALRSQGPEHLAAVLALAAQWKGRGVIAVDVAGDETSFPLAPLVPTLRSTSVPLTLHAGENGSSGPINVEHAITTGARRIGHALSLQGRSHLCDMVRNSHVYVECCLTANCTGAGKVPTDAFHLHPVREMLQQGVRVAGFNCDNLLLSGTLQNRPDPTAEVVRAKVHCGLTWRQIAQVLVDGVRASFVEFASETEREQFISEFESEVFHVLGDQLDL